MWIDRAHDHWQMHIIYMSNRDNQICGALYYVHGMCSTFRGHAASYVYARAFNIYELATSSCLVAPLALPSSSKAGRLQVRASPSHACSRSAGPASRKSYPGFGRRCGCNGSDLRDCFGFPPSANVTYGASQDLHLSIPSRFDEGPFTHKDLA